MNTSFFEDPRWYLATTLRERLELRKSAGSAGADIGAASDHLAQRLQRWRTQGRCMEEGSFVRRVAGGEISEVEFEWALGLSGESLRDLCSSPPLWLQDFAYAFSDYSEYRQPPVEEPGPLCPPIARIVAPLMALARRRCHESISSFRHRPSPAPFDLATAGAIMSAGLTLGVHTLLSRAVVLELNVARLEGRLQGDTTEARFEHFIATMAQPGEALRFLHEYPVLARLLTECVTEWADVSIEFLQRLDADWEFIRQRLARGVDTGPLTAVDAEVGDHHNLGRSVIIATFSSGFRLVYKPRSLATDVHFNELLGWINAGGAQPGFRALTIIDRGTYGWTEFVGQEACKTSEELIRYHERVGGYLAILYALGATDMHYENLIASGEHPFLVDLEALFHARVDEPQSDTADGAGRLELLQSVMGVGLLPQRIGATNSMEGIDLSGLGATSGQLTPFALPLWEARGTDEMRLIRKRVLDPGAQNRPSINGEEVGVECHVDSIVAGFSNTYRLLTERRHGLLAESGPLERFAEDQVRVIFRGTRSYAILLYESLHPDVLRNAVDRDSLFDRLWVKAEENPRLSRIVPFEIADMWHGDVPRFTTSPNSRDLRSAAGELIANFLDEASIDCVTRRLGAWNEKHLARQVWVIRASMTSSATATIEVSHTVPTRRVRPEIGQSELLSSAIAVGDRLRQLAIHGRDDASWIGLTVVDQGHSYLLPLDLDLYDGLPGVILFLAHLGQIAGERSYTRLAGSALNALRRSIESHREYTTSIGGFNGWGGVVHLFTQLGTIWNEPSLMDEAEDFCQLVHPLVEKDKELDVMGGAAGCLAALLNLYDRTGSVLALREATACGNRLVSSAGRTGSVSGWNPLDSSEEPLTGFAHGAAGIAWALLRLSAATSDCRFRTTALAAIAYERSVFSEERQNWPDLRTLGKTTLNSRKDLVTWCHGATGIGLARMASLPYLDDATTRTEIHAALNTTIKHGFGLNLSLCHGDLGNLELLIQASERLEDPEWSGHLQRKTAAILDRIKTHGWICGTPSHVESPGLMTGLAGIGYQLLRLAAPRRVPSALLLESVERRGSGAENPAAREQAPATCAEGAGYAV